MSERILAVIVAIVLFVANYFVGKAAYDMFNTNVAGLTVFFAFLYGVVGVVLAILFAFICILILIAIGVAITGES